MALMNSKGIDGLSVQNWQEDFIPKTIGIKNKLNFLSRKNLSKKIRRSAPLILKPDIYHSNFPPKIFCRFYASTLPNAWMPGYFPKEVFKAAGELGFMGLYTNPADFAGLGLPRLDAQLFWKTGVWRYVNRRIHDHSQHGRLDDYEFAKPEVAENTLPELLAGENWVANVWQSPMLAQMPDAGSLKPKRS